MNSPAGTEAGQPPAIRLPDPPSLFTRRARRLRELAAITPGLADYLWLMADLAGRQAELAAGPAAEVEGDGGHGAGSAIPPAEPLLALTRAAWGPILHPLLKPLTAALPAASPALAITLRRLDGAAPEDAERWLAALVCGAARPEDIGVLPFVAAALQIVMARQASRLDPAALAQSSVTDRCPVCGGDPVAGSLGAEGGNRGLRYLHCGFCASAWLHPRIQCVYCGSGEATACYGIEGAAAAARAEACDTCLGYLKRIDYENHPDADPCADDLATLALDLLMGEQGYRRAGHNPLLPLSADSGP